MTAPPPLEETIERAGYPYSRGAVPPEDELDAVWGRVPTVSHDDAEQLVIAGIFAGLNVTAMLPAVEAACEQWRPDVVLHDSAEYASALVAEARGIPHARIAVSLTVAETEMLAVAAPALDGRRPGLAETIAAAPLLTLFPPSLEAETAEASAPHRFRDGTAAAPRPLPDWWPGDERPLVYVTFGSVTGQLPVAGAIYRAALEAVDGLDARVLLTVGHHMDRDALGPAPENVQVEAWVPQADVLEHAAVVVCHGGSGTTLGAMAAEIRALPPADEALAVVALAR